MKIRVYQHISRQQATRSEQMVRHSLLTSMMACLKMLLKSQLIRLIIVPLKEVYGLAI